MGCMLDDILEMTLFILGSALFTPRVPAGRDPPFLFLGIPCLEATGMPLYFRNMPLCGYVDAIDMEPKLLSYGKADFRGNNLGKCRTSPVLPYRKNRTVTVGIRALGWAWGNVYIYERMLSRGSDVVSRRDAPGVQRLERKP